MNRFLANVDSRSRYFMLSRPSICRVVCLSSATLVRAVHPTHPVEIVRNVSWPFCTLATRWHSRKISRRSSQGTPPVGGLNARGVVKYSDFGPIEGYISETVHDRRYVSINH